VKKRAPPQARCAGSYERVWAFAYFFFSAIGRDQRVVSSDDGRCGVYGLGDTAGRHSDSYSDSIAALLGHGHNFFERDDGADYRDVGDFARRHTAGGYHPTRGSSAFGDRNDFDFGPDWLDAAPSESDRLRGTFKQYVVYVPVVAGICVYVSVCIVRRVVLSRLL
jgi:hypothetical protein